MHFEDADNLTERHRRKACTLGWSEHVHPEGAPFFYDPQRRLITDNDVNDPCVAALLSSAHIALLRTQEQYFEWENCDMCLTVNVEDGTCAYYFADHSNESIFHLEDVTSDDLGLPHASSETQIRELCRLTFYFLSTQ